MYIVDANADEPIMLINKHIGYNDEDGVGIIGGDFARELLYLDSLGKKRIQVWINSPGGTVMDGYDIYSAMLKSKTKIDTYCVGICASIAAVIFQAGRNRVMADYGILMYHNPFGTDNTAGLEAMRNSIITMIASRSQMSNEDVANMMNCETFILANDALNKKLCDEIEVSTDFNRKRLQSVTDVKDSAGMIAQYRAAKEVFNSIFSNTIQDMKKVTNKLNLNEAANEDAICSAIDAVQNRATAAETRVTALETEINTQKEAVRAEQQKLTDLQNKYDALEQKEREATTAANLEKAKNMVKTVGAGRIKNDAAVIKAWEDRAVADFDGTKNLLETLPLNKDAVNIVTDAENKLTDKDGKQLPSIENAVAQDMARIKNRWDKKQAALREA